jgi:hypothetical protein
LDLLSIYSKKEHNKTKQNKKLQTFQEKYIEKLPLKMGLQQSKDELVYQQVSYGNAEGIKALCREGAGLEVLLLIALFSPPNQSKFFFFLFFFIFQF